MSSQRNYVSSFLWTFSDWRISGTTSHCHRRCMPNRQFSLQDSNCKIRAWEDQSTAFICMRKQVTVKFARSRSWSLSWSFGAANPPPFSSSPFRPVSQPYFSKELKAILRYAGPGDLQINGHSFRSGGATSAYLAGKSELQLLRL